MTRPSVKARSCDAAVQLRRREVLGALCGVTAGLVMSRPAAGAPSGAAAAATSAAAAGAGLAGDGTLAVASAHVQRVMLDEAVRRQGSSGTSPFHGCGAVAELAAAIESSLRSATGVSRGSEERRGG